MSDLHRAFFLQTIGNEMRHPRRGAGYRDSWWTPQRDEKLLYVMNKYKDLSKAARVLGCPRYACYRRLKALNWSGW